MKSQAKGCSNERSLRRAASALENEIRGLRESDQAGVDGKVETKGE